MQALLLLLIGTSLYYFSNGNQDPFYYYLPKCDRKAFGRRKFIILLNVAEISGSVGCFFMYLVMWDMETLQMNRP